MGQQTINMLCECESFTCPLSISLTIEEAMEAHGDGNLMIINGCANGPKPTDVLVKKKDRYSIYREK